MVIPGRFLECSDRQADDLEAKFISSNAARSKQMWEKRRSRLALRRRLRMDEPCIRWPFWPMVSMEAFRIRMARQFDSSFRKYGFKIKSIVKIRFVESQPTSMDKMHRANRLLFKRQSKCRSSA
jgi:hypothetical protein